MIKEYKLVAVQLNALKRKHEFRRGDWLWNKETGELVRVDETFIKLRLSNRNTAARIYTSVELAVVDMNEPAVMFDYAYYPIGTPKTKLSKLLTYPRDPRYRVVMREEELMQDTTKVVIGDVAIPFNEVDVKLVQKQIELGKGVIWVSVLERDEKLERWHKLYNQRDVKVYSGNINEQTEHLDRNWRLNKLSDIKYWGSGTVYMFLNYPVTVFYPIEMDLEVNYRPLPFPKPITEYAESTIEIRNFE